MPRKVLESTLTITKNADGTTESEDRKIKYRADGEPEYVKLYLNAVLYLKSLPRGYNPILMAFLKRMSYATTGQKVYVNAEMKREIAAEVGSSVSYINNAITDFVKGKLMLRVGTGTYQFNPQIFGKGDWKDIEKIRATITFSPDGTDFEAELTRTDRTKKHLEEENLEKLGQIRLPISESA